MNDLTFSIDSEYTQTFAMAWIFNHKLFNCNESFRASRHTKDFNSDLFITNWFLFSPINLSVIYLNYCQCLQL